MKKTITILFIAFLVNGVLINAQTKGFVYDNLSMKSSVLGKDVRYSIYLPPDYKSSEISYPVLYLFHGYTDDHISWIQWGQMNITMDKCIESGYAPSMIVVMPDAGVSWYINSAEGKERYEDMFFEELIPYVDKTYRTRSEKRYRAVAGLSMGGYGALIYALKHPDMFSACCPLAPGIFLDRAIEEMPDKDYKTILSPFNQEGVRLDSHWYANSTMKLVEDMPDSQKDAVSFYFDCGDDDFLYEGNSMMHILLRKKGIKHEFRMRDGDHTWEYWRTALPEVVHFVGNSFHR